MDGFVVILVIAAIVSALSKSAQRVKQRTEAQKAGEGQAPLPNAAPARKATPASVFPNLYGQEPQRALEIKPTVAEAPVRQPAAPRMDKDGEDDCHEYMLGDAFAVRTETAETEAPAEFPLTFDRNSLLQGVIMSEILTRPAARRARRVGRA